MRMILPMGGRVPPGRRTVRRHQQARALPAVTVRVRAAGVTVLVTVLPPGRRPTGPAA